jgi:hypothetical protein
MGNERREIGPVGTVARVIVAMAVLYIAGGSTIASWSIDPKRRRPG